MAKTDSTAAAVSDNPLPKKDLYEVGEIPPLGHVPAKMYAWDHPPRAPRPARARDAGGSRADLGTRQP